MLEYIFPYEGDPRKNTQVALEHASYATIRRGLVYTSIQACPWSVRKSW